MKEKQYIVAIKCTVYNHEPYLRDCLNGFVMQKTNFPFIAIVHDDASTDKSADIIREYADKYPDIIHPIYETENQYSKHDGSLSRIMNNAVDATGAKYIAICEGDDYWTDSLKLQKQVDFLESHPDYVACLHKTSVLNEAKRKLIFCGERLQVGELYPKNIFPQWVAHINSLLMKTGTCERWPIKHIEWMESGDTRMILQCMHVGKVWALPDTMSVYRMNDNSAMAVQRSDVEEIGRYTRHLKAFLLNFPKIDKGYCYMEIAEYDLERFKRNDGNKWRWYYLFDAWYWASTYMFTKKIKAIKQYFKKLIHKTYV